MIPYIIEAIKTQDGKLEGINTQLAEQGLKLDSLSEELKILAGRVEKVEAEVDRLKEANKKQQEFNLELQERIKKLENR